MKKTLLVTCLLLVSLMLCACGHNMQTTGVVDCYTIRVTNDGNSVISNTYNVSYAEVHEYTNDKGDSIYTDKHIYSTYDNEKETTIHAYKDRYSGEYDVYNYSGFIGWLRVEYNYYLDLDNNIIDSETKWSEFIYDTDPFEVQADNKTAYKCAKKNYYILSNYYYYADVYSLRLDMTESSLERHTYTKLGEDSVIYYQAKWF